MPYWSKLSFPVLSQRYRVLHRRHSQIGIALFTLQIAFCALGDIREAPVPRAPAAAGIGRLSPELTTSSVMNTQVSFRPNDREHALVIALTSTTCPISKKFAPLLGRMSQDDQTPPIRWIFVDVTGSNSPNDFADFAKKHQFSGDLVHDPKLEVASALDATSTTEAILIDRTGTIRYRGCVDDRYGIGYAHDAPRMTPLLDAIVALSDDQEVPLLATSAPGCALTSATAQPGEDTPTYHGTVSRIIQANCLTCHRTGGAAPFPLETYEQVRSNAAMIRRVVSRGTMPPWFAGPQERHDYGLFSNDQSLPEADRTAIIAWAEEGRPEGSASSAPLPRTFDPSWTIGTPDHTVQLPSAQPIKAEGEMPYVDIQVPTGLVGDTWVQGWEILPTDRSVVHHALIFIVPKGRRRQFGATDGFLAAYVPGNSATIYPDGFAKYVPAGCDLHFQIHYTPNGTATTDQMTLGLLIADEPPTHEMRTIGIADRRLRIPPGAAAHVESATLMLPADVNVFSVTPHMHIRGAAFEARVEEPDGSTKTLIHIPSYDFNWQLGYRFAQPPVLPKGSKVTVQGTFDNSTANPGNPDPTQQVRFGKQTDDEMLIGYFEYWLNDEEDPDTLDRASDDQIFFEEARRLIARWDKDGDKRVSREEVPERRRFQFDLIDLNDDGLVDELEFVEAARQLLR